MNLKIEYIICFVAFIACGGCQGASLIGNKGPEVDTSYLQTSGNLYLVENYSVKENLNILLMAERRMGKYKYASEGRFKWDIASGKDIRISEDLFEYVLEIWKQENRLIECGLYKVKKKKGRYVLSPTKMPIGDTINSPDPENLEWKYGGISYRDSIFLRIEGDLLREPQNIWENSTAYSIYSRAVERLYQQVFAENGYIKWDITRGRDVKVSENIFVYITGEWRRDNEKIKTGKYELRRDLIGGGLFAVPKDEPFAPNDWGKVR